MLSDYELHDREIERSRDIADHYERVKQNLTDEINAALDLLNPFYRTQYQVKLQSFADRLEEIAEMASELAEKF